MSKKHVHWWDGEAVRDDSDNASFLPPSPGRSPSASSIDDNDSLVDSPSPPTPLTTLAPIAASPGTYQSRHLAGGAFNTIRIPASLLPDARFKTLDVPPWHLGECYPEYEAPGMLGRSVPSVGPIVSSHKSSDATLPRQTRQKPSRSSDATLPRQTRQKPSRSSGLHTLLVYDPSTRTPALTWNVDDAPSYSTVLMTTATEDGQLVPVPPNVLDEPATNPPLTEMRIHCIGYSLWDPLLLRVDDIRSPQSTDVQRGIPERASVKTTKYIAIKHVIFAMYSYLHRPMSNREYDALKQLPIPDLQTSVAKSFYRRCEADERRILALQRSLPERGINSSSPSERSGANVGKRSAREDGLRRMDCLLGQTRFLGLSKVPGTSIEWYMNVTHCP